MIKVIKCLSYLEALEASKDLKNTVAIETEYGDQYFGVKDGAKIELLHHGKFKKNLPSCLQMIPEKDNKSINHKFNNFIVSHFDLDTIFGIMWAGGYLKKTKVAIEISKLVALIDINGFYDFKINIFNQENKNHIIILAISSLLSFWTIDKKNPSKDIHKLILRIRDYIILGVPEETLKFLDIKNDKEENSFLKQFVKTELTLPGILITYIGGVSLTDRYKFNFIEHEMIVQYNSGSNSITLACRNETISKRFFGNSGVIEPLKTFFGNDAGGHLNIGGSPRNQKLQIEMLDAFIKFLKRTYFNIGI